MLGSCLVLPDTKFVKFTNQKTKSRYTVNCKAGTLKNERKEVIIMSIDWEYLLDAEGDELQDAYDQAVEEASEMLDWDYDY